MEYFSRLSAAVCLIMLFPLFIILIILSFIFQGLPIFFLHNRIGYKYNNFTIFKFRSMNIIRKENQITEKNDIRITNWGKIIRFLKLDEIPQLFNILKGDMRFVGPRPEVEEYVKNNDFSFLNKIKPGVTDFSSIIFRNESNILDKIGGAGNYQRLLTLKVKLANLYSDNKSFWLDIILIIITILSIFSQKIATFLVINLFISRLEPNLKTEIKIIIE